MAYLFTTTSGQYDIFCDGEGVPIMIDYRRRFREVGFFIPHRIYLREYLSLSGCL
ncbi:MAG: hypothetical protein HY831_03840 [Candidatus Aenigmarchaeota archaeon]|nr:hypothetical protein [Candidatus Aenigmarchaeota archaeon]